jgi:hypothetical protein
MIWPLLAVLALGAAPGSADQAVLAFDGIARMSGFPSVVMSHIERTIGTMHLPTANGTALDSGMFVTIGPDRMYVFDHESTKLRQGRVAERTVAPECVSKCPAALFDAFQYEWLQLAVESSALATRIPQVVHIAADTTVAATTLVEVAYAASETRPAAPPQLSLLVNMPGRGLRALPFHLVPPQGLELQQGSAALGLTVEFGQGTYKIRASDPSFARDARVQKLSQVQSLLNDLRKRYPNKRTVILVPDDSVSVGQLVQLVVVAMRADFTRIVLSFGQDVYV